MANEVKWKTILEAAENNDMDAIKYFVEEKHVPMTTCNEDELTAAHIALKNNNTELLKYLVKKDPSIVTATDKKARNILIQAVDQGALDVIKFLLEEQQEDVEEPHNLYYGNTAIHIAALRGKLEILKYFLEDRNLDVNIRSGFEETPLFLAAERVNMPIVKYLVGERKARTSLTDKNHDNVLFISARKGDLNVPRYILDELKKNIDLNHRDFFGETVLHRAVKFQHFPFIEYLIDEKGINLNLPDDEGCTPLHRAAENGHLAMVEFLCDGGAFTHLKNDRNQTAVDLTKDPQVVDYLKRAMSDPDERRRRRSAPGWFFSDAASQVKTRNDRIGPEMTQNPKVISYRYRFPSVDVKIVVRAQSQSSNVGQFDKDLTPGDHVANSLNGVLTIIGAGLKFPYMKNYMHARSASLSQQDVLQNNMDSSVIDAVREEFD